MCDGRPHRVHSIVEFLFGVVVEEDEEGALVEAGAGLLELDDGAGTVLRTVVDVVVVVEVVAEAAAALLLYEVEPTTSHMEPPVAEEDEEAAVAEAVVVVVDVVVVVVVVALGFTGGRNFPSMCTLA